MRILVVFILFLLGTSNGEQVSDNGNGCGNPTPTSDSEIRFHESQIRKADSLYKNYLPQYNFDEVKAAMEFFDSLGYQRQQTTVNGQQTFSTEVKQSRALVMHTQGLLTVVRCPLTLSALKRITTTLWVSRKKTTLLVLASIIS